MQYINRLSDYRDSKESAVTFGKFDGLHKGHQKLIEKVQEFGRQEDLASIVCAFDMQPLWERMGTIPQILMTAEERRRYLDGKITALVHCPFTREFGRIEAEDFIRDIICGLIRRPCYQQYLYQGASGSGEYLLKFPASGLPLRDHREGGAR